MLIDNPAGLLLWVWISVSFSCRRPARLGGLLKRKGCPRVKGYALRAGGQLAEFKLLRCERYPDSEVPSPTVAR
jgi:hypothetical protein